MHYKLSDKEIGELRALFQLIKKEELKLELVSLNTSQVHKGQDWCKTQKGIILRLKEYQTSLINAVARDRSFEGTVTIDLEQGVIQKKV